MSDLFKNPPPTSSDYSAKDIEVLEGLEPVRRRPGMYIGGTDENALHHLVAEIVDNAMDEAVAGHASRIEVSLDQDGYITVKDNGRGIPIDPHPKFPDKSALEVIMTTLHSGGKFSGKAYETSGGLHGVGLSVVNALSDDLCVEVISQKKLWRQVYKQGDPVTPLTDEGPLANRRGTSIRFHPDVTIFDQGSRFRPARLYGMIRSKAYLFRGVDIRWECAPELIKEKDTTPTSDRLHFPGGLSDFLAEKLTEKELVIPNFFAGEAPFSDGSGRIEWAVSWPAYDEGEARSYCNTVVTPLGGTHENGFRNALTKGLRQFGDQIGNRKAAQLTADDCLGGAVLLISAFVRNPQFQGQTKDKLVSADVTRLIEAAVKDRFDHWLSERRDDSETLLTFVIDRLDQRLRRRQAKEANRQSVTKRLRLPGKLSDCISTDIRETELFLVEGDSAGGSAKQARNRQRQAVLPLRGKILNVASATPEKALSNQEISDLGKALGCGVGSKSCDPSALRYGRIIIMTDADVDGAHIATLLMTFFFLQMRPVLEQGHIYLAVPPLYRITQGTKSFYAQDDHEKEACLKKLSGKGKIDISRFKGLGEMSWHQLKETTMDPKTRTLLQVTIPESLVGLSAHDPSLQVKIEEFIDHLMGRKPEHRFAYIQNNASLAGDLDI